MNNLSLTFRLRRKLLFPCEYPGQFSPRRRDLVLAPFFASSYFLACSKKVEGHPSSEDIRLISGSHGEKNLHLNHTFVDADEYNMLQVCDIDQQGSLGTLSDHDILCYERNPSEALSVTNIGSSINGVLCNTTTLRSYPKKFVEL